MDVRRGLVMVTSLTLLPFGLTQVPVIELQTQRTLCLCAACRHRRVTAGQEHSHHQPDKAEEALKSAGADPGFTVEGGKGNLVLDVKSKDYSALFAGASLRPGVLPPACRSAMSRRRDLRI